MSAVLFHSERAAESEDEEPVVGLCPYPLLNRNGAFQIAGLLSEILFEEYMLL